ncbi:MAG TPA: UDP-N-acetylmuramoyl-L-alanine--D-glutamate ligase, partial [Chloroflexota bacterium]|nr:UDP-N-acetylmuramoyl-L-alanine--D-glutamate ligase [Chloroflexota bacterium]
MTKAELAEIDFRNKRVTLIGLGRRTNVHLARFLVRQGARVRISEQRSADALAEELALIRELPVELTLGGHRESDVTDAEIVYVTPGVPRELPILVAARERGIPISNEIELLFARCPAPIVGITGSAGKTTTTTLTGLILSQGARRVFVGGNIGTPLIDRVDTIAPDDLVVLELSSFQLETIPQSAHIGALLNVTPNHLDRHGTFENYRESKFNLLRYQGPADIAILGADDPVAASLVDRCAAEVRWFSNQTEVARGAFRRGDDLLVRDEGGEAVFAEVSALRLPGDHNVRNVLAAAAISRAAGASVEQIAGVVTSFGGVEHRLEHLRELNGVSYYNDSIATAPERTMAALRSFSRPVILIAGGRSKHLPTDELAREIARHARAVVTTGEMAEEIEEAVAGEPSARAVV